MSWDSDDWMGKYARALGLTGFGSYGRLQPMTAYGRYTARLDRGDSDFKASNEEISDELTAALKRIAITSARATP